MEIKQQLRIAIVQFDIKWESPDANLIHIEKLLEDYKIEADIVVLPEAFTTGFSMNAERIAETVDGVTLNWMKELASSHGYVVCGSFFVKENDTFFNRFFWVEPDGRILNYDKRHLFSMEGENKDFSSGDKQLLIEYCGWKIFPQICYDLRFPVWSRNIHNYDLLINVANWPASRTEVWKTLLKARSIENQCYVVAVNRVGTDMNPIEYAGDSLVFDPKGIKMFIAPNREIIETVTLDLDSLHAFRKKFNTLKDMDRFHFD